MKVKDFLWQDEIVEKIAVKHGVETWEAEEIFADNPRIRFRQKGNRPGEDVYTAMGQTGEGRHLFVVFIYKPPNQDRLLGQALVVSARDMEEKEKKQYERK